MHCVYSGKKYLCVAENGDEYYVVTTVYMTSEYYGELSVNDNESNKFNWVSLDDLPENIAGTHKDIINDFINRK